MDINTEINNKNDNKDTIDDDETYMFVNGVGFIKGSKRRVEISNIKYIASMFGFALMMFMSICVLVGDSVKRLYLSYSQGISGQGQFFLPMLEITTAIVGVAIVIVPYFTYYLLVKNECGAVIRNKRVDLYSFVNIVVFCLCLLELCHFFTNAFNVGLYFMGIDVVDKRVIPPTGSDFLIYAVLYILVLPFFQEFIFRGIVLSSIKKINVGIALFAQAFANCLFSSNMSDMVSIFIISFALGYIYLITNNFWLLLVARGVMNFFDIFTDMIYTQISFRLGNIIINMFLALILIVGLISTRYILQYVNLNARLFKKSGVLESGEVAKVFITSPAMVCAIILSIIFVINYALSTTIW